MSAIAPLSNILSGATRNALQGISKLQGPQQVLPKSGISEFFQNFFKTAPKVAIPTATKTGAGTIKSIFSKTNVVSGTILGSTLASTLFLSTPQGQNTVNTTARAVKDITQIGSNITDFFNKNPIVPIGLLILGGLVVVSVIKK